CARSRCARSRAWGRGRPSGWPRPDWTPWAISPMPHAACSSGCSGGPGRAPCTNSRAAVTRARPARPRRRPPPERRGPAPAARGQVEPPSAEASSGAEETSAPALLGPDAVARALLDLSRTAGRRLRRAGRAGHTIVLKVRFADFTTVTRSERIETPVHRDREL